MDYVRWHDRPKLKRPVLVAAFEGWNDAADAATSAARFLRDHWGARQFAEINPEEFYDFSSTRPQVRLVDGLTREIVWPANELYAASVPGSERDVIVLQATVNGDRVAQLFFDPTSGLLLRLLRFTITPIAFVPTQLDYADYRELPGLGVKIPFQRTLTQTYMQMTLQFTDVQANAPIDAARFAKPAPAKLQSEK